MPIYEYRCLSCHKKFELLMGVVSSPKLECPHCKSLKVEKLFSSFGFRSSGETNFSSGAACSACTTTAPCGPCKTR